MKKNCLLVITITLHGLLFSQVGIYNDQPKGSFQLDAKKNNKTISPPVSYSDDIIVTNEGNVGIGTITPSEKLEVQGTTLFKGKVTVNDGTQAAGKIFKSDENGKGKWSSFTFLKRGIIDYTLNSSMKHTSLEHTYLMGDNASAIISGNTTDLGLKKVSFFVTQGTVNNGFTLGKGSYLCLLSSNIAPSERGQKGAEYGIIRIRSDKRAEEVLKTYYYSSLSGSYFYLQTEGNENFYMTFESIDPGIKSEDNTSFFLSPPYTTQGDKAQLLIILLKKEI